MPTGKFWSLSIGKICSAGIAHAKVSCIIAASQFSLERPCAVLVSLEFEVDSGYLMSVPS